MIPPARALLRYRGRAVLGAPLTRTLLPGGVAGSLIRVGLLSGAQVFYLVIAAVLLPIGVWLAVGRRASGTRRAPAGDDSRISAAALVVGIIGGIYFSMGHRASTCKNSLDLWADDRSQPWRGTSGECLITRRDE